MKDKGITVVFAIYDPVGGTVIKSLADLGENITGNQICGSVSKKLDWLLKFPPGIKTILVPVTFDTPATKLNLEELRQAVELKGINLIIPEL